MKWIRRTRSRMRILFSALALLLLCGSCITGQFVRWSISEPINPWRIALIKKGSDLSQCLDQLGAPTGAMQQGQRYVLYYAWMVDTDREVSIQFLPNANFFESSIASVSYSRESEKWQSVRLVFDEDWKVVSVVSGRGISPAEFEAIAELERNNEKKRNDSCNSPIC